MIDNFEAVCKAHAIFKGLRYGPSPLDAVDPSMRGTVAGRPQFTEYRALMDRARALPAEPTCAELLSLFDAFLTYSAQYEITIPEGEA